MKNLRRFLVVLCCLGAIALVSCLGPVPRSANPDGVTGENGTASQASSPAGDNAASSDQPKNLEFSKEERAKIADLAYLSGRANTSPVEERVVLLGFKHDIDRRVVENILYDYLDIHGGFKSDANYVQTIYDLRDRYDLTPQQLAQLVMDYKAWLSLNRNPL